MGKGAGTLRQIPLTQGKVALVDEGDYEELAKHKWCARKNRNVWYAQRTLLAGDGRRASVLMHRQILGSPVGQVVDHQDGDGLNNQRSNLRECTTAENRRNQHIKQSGCSSLYKGVFWDKGKGKWRASIEMKGRYRSLGRFAVEADAARAYNAAAMRMFGEFACLNRIDE